MGNIQRGFSPRRADGGGGGGGGATSVHNRQVNKPFQTHRKLPRKCLFYFIEIILVDNK